MTPTRDPPPTSEEEHNNNKWNEEEEDDHSYASEEEEDEGLDDHDDNDDDDDDDGLWSDLVSSWKQHVVAVGVALLATVVYHQLLMQDNHSKGGLVDIQSLQISLPFLGGSKHPHVHSYERTSDLYFCPELHDTEKTRLRSGTMDMLDFRVPRTYLDLLHHYYWADQLEDDTYSLASSAATDKDDNNIVVDHSLLIQEYPQYACLKRLERETASDASFVKARTYVYKNPTYKSMYRQGRVPNKHEVSLSFTGFAVKFVNLSPTPVLLHWDGKGGNTDSSKLIGEIAPYESVGTATTPGQSFYVSPILDGSQVLKRWVLTEDEALVLYDPHNQIDATTPQGEVQQQPPPQLSPEHSLKYQMQMLNWKYAEEYLIKTGRTWLGTFPRPSMTHHMHNADYFGKLQTIATTHLHYTEQQQNEGEEEEDNPVLELQLKTVSVTPRVFTIDNFLSTQERKHLVQLAQAQGMEQSTVHGSSSSRTTDDTNDDGTTTNTNAMKDVKTRSSTTTWIERRASEVVNGIYQRAADVFQIDESLLRHRSEEHTTLATHNSIAESLQLVRYRKNQEYTPHHDFVYPRVTNRYQPTRYATLLLYLNDNFEGGETTFPRATNGEYHDGIKIQPKAGTAVLFYNMLPDGNVDDLSQHGGAKVVNGTKWIANLWVWDPIID